MSQFETLNTGCFQGFGLVSDKDETPSFAFPSKWSKIGTMAAIRKYLATIQLLALLGLISSSIFAEAQGMEGASVGQTFTFQTSPGQACDLKVKKATVMCFTEADALQAQAASAAVGTSAPLVSAGTSVDLGTAGAGVAAQGVAANAAASNMCTGALVLCEGGCQTPAAQINEYIATYEMSEYPPPELPAYLHDRTEVQRAVAYCKTTFKLRAAMYAGAGVDSSAAGSMYGKFLDSVKNNATTVGILGAVGAGAYLLTKKSGGDSGGGGNSGAPGGTGSQTPEQKKIADAWKDPNCVSTNAAAYDHCQKYLTSFCASLANMEDVRCKAFSDTYCGLAETTVTSTTTDSPMGLGTQLCKDQIATRFCKMADTSNCRSCLSLKDRKSAACVARPDVCNREPTDKEMSYFKGVCPTDPVFTEPKWASIVATPTTTASTTSSDNTATSTLNGRDVASVNGQHSTTAMNLTGSGSATANGTASNVVADVEPDVAQAFGPGVFDRSSLAVQEVCKRAWLNGCGPRLLNY